jgi:hypothetical protein
LPDYPVILGGGKDRLLYNTLSPQRLSKLIPGKAREIFMADFMAFTSAVHELSDRRASVYVDGVKSISRVFALTACGVQVDGVIHLQRDPGDYVQSTMKQPGFSRRDYIPRLINYRLFHNRARRIGRKLPYISLTYEGLADSPEASLERLFRFLGVRPMSLSKLLDEGKQQPWHFMGNRSLFKFDGNIRRSSHPQTRVERAVTRILAGPYDAHSRHLSGN